jgi:hypothetical protein
MADERRGNRFHPYQTLGQYHWAKKLSSTGHESRSDLKAFILDGENCAPASRYRSINEYYSYKEILTGCLTDWQKIKIEFPDKETVYYYRKDTLAVLQEILENKALADKCIWAPKWQSNSDGERIYTDMYSCNFWLNLQVS